jgi:hypothetical protein
MGDIHEAISTSAVADAPLFRALPLPLPGRFAMAAILTPRRATVHLDSGLVNIWATAQPMHRRRLIAVASR